MITMEPGADTIQLMTTDGTYTHLTKAEIAAAYLYQKKRCQMEDAMMYANYIILSEYSSVRLNDKEYDADKISFQARYGISYDDATSETMLQGYVEQYDQSYNPQVSEEDLWLNAVSDVISRTVRKSA